MDKKPIIEESEIRYLVESYGIFINVDKTILETNFFLEKYGYTFQIIHLEELEKNFYDLFNLPKKFDSTERIGFEDSDKTISREFYNLLMHNSLFGYLNSFNQEIYLLKRIQDYEQKVENNIVNSGYSFKIINESKRIVNCILQQFRLLRGGDIACPIQFHITKDDRKVAMKYGTNKRFGHSVFTLTGRDIKELSNSFSLEFESNKLTELALSNFNLAYEIPDIKTRYVTLMTCLESLFNLGRDQIAHTVSRHLAIIISDSSKEFEENYYNLKKLYSTRSTIVHGGEVEGLADITNELFEKVRLAIRFCLSLNESKKELFNRLNLTGFVNK